MWNFWFFVKIWLSYWHFKISITEFREVNRNKFENLGIIHIQFLDISEPNVRLL